METFYAHNPLSGISDYGSASEDWVSDEYSQLTPTFQPINISLSSYCDFTIYGPISHRAFGTPGRTTSVHGVTGSWGWLLSPSPTAGPVAFYQETSSSTEIAQPLNPNAFMLPNSDWLPTVYSPIAFQQPLLPQELGAGLFNDDYL